MTQPNDTTRDALGKQVRQFVHNVHVSCIIRRERTILFCIQIAVNHNANGDEYTSRLVCPLKECKYV